MNYQEFLSRKRLVDAPSGLTEIPKLNPALFDFQRDIVKWALKRGRAALFEDCGLGKTIQQLQWAQSIHESTGKDMLILSPLGVADQTVEEGEKFGFEVRYCRDQKQARRGLTITNYEMLEHFDPSSFGAVALDEPSFLKSYMGKTKRSVLSLFRRTPYKLPCIATPSPNDYMELGNYAEFLGVMPSSEMLARFFINDTERVGHYTLKGHAEKPFWEWVASWAVCITKPSDLGYSDAGYELPPLNVNEVVVEANHPEFYEAGSFLPKPALSSTEIHKVMRKTTAARAEKLAEIAATVDGPMVLWCNTDYESKALAECIPGAVELRGSEPLQVKLEKLRAFRRGQIGRFITKGKIAGYGQNWQEHCHNMGFMINYSYEMFYQCLARCHRFGQKHPVNAWVVVAETEIGVLETLRRKQEAHRRMQRAMVEAMRTAEMHNIGALTRQALTQSTGSQKIIIPDWIAA